MERASSCVALVAAAFVAAAGCTSSTEGAGGDAGESVPDVDVDEGRAIAAGFLRAQVEAGNRPEWREAFVGELVTYLDSDGVVQAYEAAVIDGGSGARVPAGWIMVEAWEELAPVSAFATVGASNAASLEARYRAEHGQDGLAVDAMVPLWVGPGSAALDVRRRDGSVVRVASTPELRGLVYDGARRLAEARTRPADPEDLEPSARQRSRLREVYGAAGFDARSMGGSRVTVDRSFVAAPNTLGVDVGSGAASFAPFDQEQRQWTPGSSGYCHTGCTPVAFGIVMEYWDRNGYPRLVGTADDNANTSHEDVDVRSMMTAFRTAMHTECVAGDPTLRADTSSLNEVLAIEYFNLRGEGTWTTDTVWLDDRWGHLMEQIAAENPVVLSYNYRFTGWWPDHSAVAYEYTDNAGSANDWICVQKGWGFRPDPARAVTWECFARTEVGGGYHVTTIERPAGGSPGNPGPASARVRVTGVSPGANQFVCASGYNHPPRRATPVAPGAYETTVPVATAGAKVDMVFWLSTRSDCLAGWTRDLWPATNPYTVNGQAVGRCVPRLDEPAHPDWSYVRGTINADGTVSNSGTRACPGATGGGAAGTARVVVSNIVPAAGEFVCAAGLGRAAAAGGGTYEVTMPLTSLPGVVDTVFWASTSQTCAGDSWRRDYWPGANPYTVNGRPATRCVARPENSTWSYVRATVNADGSVADSGNRDCPGGGGGAGTATARVTAAGITPGAGEYICVAGAGRANLIGGLHAADVPIGALPAVVDVVFWASGSPTCDDDWRRDYWPGANPYAINGQLVTMCVARPENPTWRSVRGTVTAGGVVDSGTLPCPGPSPWSALAVNTTITASVGQGAERRYSFPRVAGRTYTITLHPTAGDPDLYTSKHATITRETALCRSENGAGVDDVCSFVGPDTGPNYIIVYGYTAATYTLRVTES